MFNTIKILLMTLLMSHVMSSAEASNVDKSCDMKIDHSCLLKKLGYDNLDPFGRPLSPQNNHPTVTNIPIQKTTTNNPSNQDIEQQAFDKKYQQCGTDGVCKTNVVYEQISTLDFTHELEQGCKSTWTNSYRKPTQSDLITVATIARDQSEQIQVRRNIQHLTRADRRTDISVIANAVKRATTSFQENPTRNNAFEVGKQYCRILNLIELAKNTPKTSPLPTTN
jgi:hypothetical protein